VYTVGIMSDVTGGSLVSSSLAQGANVAFDLHDEKSAVALLRRIHQSTLAPDDKNELRDAVFVFRNNPKSQITPEFTAKFEELGLSIDNEPTVSDEPVRLAVNEPVVEKKSVQGFGAARPSPRFTPVTPQVTPEVPNVGHSVVPPVVEVPSVRELPTEPVVAVDPVVETPQPVVAVPIAPEVPSAPAPVIPSAPEPVVSVPAVAEIPPASSAAPERIKEIKKLVNKLVGNPVNLIDVNNEVGREYMNALLDAMKKNNGGTADQVEQAMARLEVAFTSVKETLGATGEAKPVEEKSEVVVPEPEVPQVPVIEKETPPVAISSELPVSPAFSQSASDVDEPTAEGYAALQYKAPPEPEVLVEPLIPAEPITSEVPTPVIPTTPVPEVPTSTPAAPQIPQAPLPEVEILTPATGEEPATSGFTSVHQSHIQGAATVPTPAPLDRLTTPIQEPVVAANPVIPPVPAQPKPLADGMLSVAKEKQIEHLMTAKKQEAAVTDKQREDIEIAAMNPLMTPEVTNGLKQLLSEWELFKNSGLFGTGPSGSEHALYKQLSQLTMAAVVAGRYEGATPQTKRSITDYMNGWRYEEGIIQEQGELFEHYLRRVIKHILDKRK